MRRLLKTSSIGTAPAKNLAMQGDSVSDGQAAKASDRAAATCLKGIKTIIITTEDVQDNASFYCEIIL